MRGRGGNKSEEGVYGVRKVFKSIRRELQKMHPRENNYGFLNY